MSTPSIPHLSTLLPRGGTRTRGERGRARGGADSSSATSSDSPAEQAAQHDRTIQGTDNDAASSRASAVTLGYLSDPYALSFAPVPPPRRYPLINRGTYVRTTALDRLIHQFLSVSGKQGEKRQIISLGAGSDTRFFRLASQHPDLIYHELDFPTNTVAKIAKILSTGLLKTALQVASPDPSTIIIAESKDSLYSNSLNIHPLDLRLLSNPSTSPPLPNIDPKAPTLLLSECCLTYLPLPSANSILSHFLSTLLDQSTPAALLQYEPIKPLDSFGKTMTANLASRNIAMPSLHALPTLEAHRARLWSLGLAHTGARTVAHIYSASAPSAHSNTEDDDDASIETLNGRHSAGAEDEVWLSPAERARVERLEWLDEVEEWSLLAGHYCVVWGWRRGTVLDDNDVFGRAWGSVAGSWREEERKDDELHSVTSPTSQV
ncbi:hypothetical protein ANO11243_045680 [Dothideomycetidae sp. 11243]|nr:hypothetical protein ANO11243_045680 [fungal sp. No.11243]